MIPPHLPLSMPLTPLNHNYFFACAVAWGPETDRSCKSRSVDPSSCLVGLKVIEGEIGDLTVINKYRYHLKTEGNGAGGYARGCGRWVTSTCVSNDCSRSRRQTRPCSDLSCPACALRDALPPSSRTPHVSIACFCLLSPISSLVAISLSEMM